MENEKLVQGSEAIVGEQLTAAGVFKLHEDVAALFAGGVIGAAMPSFAHGATSASESDMGADAARAMVAHKKGLTPEMVVAVSERYVHVLSIPSTSGTPTNPLADLGIAEPGQELMRFDRESADIQAKAHLRKVYLKLHDSEHQLGLVSAMTESIGGAKQVLHALQG